MATPTQKVTVSLEGTGNLQTQSVVVIASSVSGTTVELGNPPSGAAPNVTVVSPAEGASIDLVNGALGIIGSSVVSGSSVASVGGTGVIKASFAGGYWLIS